MKTSLWKSRSLLTGLACAAFCASLPALADYPSTTVSQAPLGYWRLNETIQPLNSTNAVNIGSLGAAANGGYVAYASGGLPGPFAGSTSVGLDGAAQYVITPSSASLNPAAFTFEIWAQPAQVPKFAYLASAVDFAANRSGWYFAQDDGSTFAAGSAWVVRFFNLNSSTPSGQLSAPVTNAPGTWVHLVITHNGSVGSLYMNGVLITNRTAAYVPTATQPFTVGCRSTLNFFWPGKAAEVAMYNGALSAARVAAHYNAGMTAPATYQATVLADAPLLYQRYTEAGAPPAANSGTLGAAAAGAYIYDATAGVAGPSSPTYGGFEAANKAVSFSGTGPGVVNIPALNLNTNTVTISGWFKPNGSQSLGAGLVVCGTGGSASGLTIDRVDGGLGLGYVWGGNDYGIAWNRDLGLPLLENNDWNFAALVIQPTKTTLYVCDTTKYDNFTSRETPPGYVNHANQPFNVNTLIGTESGFPTRNFKGVTDEVSIWNRALSGGELYTQYASAVGGVPVRMFADLQGPADAVPLGDPVILTVDAGGTPPLSYQWRRDGTNLATTTSGVLSVPTTAIGTSAYDVTISNGSGSPVPSQQVYATVVTPSAPAITGAQGFMNRTLYRGATLRMSVSATGGGLKYQWYKNTAPISGATSSTFLIASVTNTDAGNYSVSLTNTLGRASNGPVAISIPVMATNSYAGVIIASTPEAWWRLSDPLGTTNLMDGMGRHDGYYTSVSNAAPPVTLGAPGAIVGDTNTAVSFNPNSGGVGVVPFSPDLNGIQFTYEAWVKTTVRDTYMVPFSSAYDGNGIWWVDVPTVGSAGPGQQGFWTFGGANGYYDLYTTAGVTFPQCLVVPNGWTHLVMCYDSTRYISGTQYPYSFYINGVTDGYVRGGIPVPNEGGPFIIGGLGVSSNTLASAFFNGSVDEVAVYRRVLSGVEIQAHYAARGVEVIPPTFGGTFLPQTVTSGKTVSFSTSVLGSDPIALQWLKNGAPISNATNTSLTLANVAMGDTATYTLRASNSAGTNTLSATLTVIAQTSYANTTNGNVLHLRFDGNTTDSSGRNNNGTAVGGPTYVAGIIGSQALKYSTTTVTNNGTNIAATSASYVNLGRPSDLLFTAGSSFTVGMWVKLPASYVGGDLPFIGNGIGSMNNPGWDLGPSYGAGGWQWCLNDGVTAGLTTTNNFDANGAAGSINDGNWHYFVLTVDRVAKQASGYLDGLLMVRTDITGLGSLDNGATIALGQDPTHTYPQITGASANDLAAWAGLQTSTLDDVGIWTRALTAAEVAQIESAGRLGGRSFDTPAPSPVVLNVTPSGANLTLSWQTGTLLQSDTLGAGAVWTPVPGAVAPSYNVSIGGAQKFYRVWTQ